ncbi:CCA-adding enzyme [compost metagenome]
MEGMKNKGLSIINKLNEFGYEAYFVGGSVRNTLHNSTHKDSMMVKDYDIVTSASYEVVSTMFDHVETRGEQFKVAVVNIDGDEFEVAQYRGESYPEGGSLRPTEVHSVKSLVEDLQRRDFTINAIVEDKDGVCIDRVGGLTDLYNKQIKTIGDANKRFSEDPLRMLRAFRFASQLGYSIAPKTIEGILNNIDKLSIIPHERVAGEMEKLLAGKYVRTALYLMDNMNINFGTFYNSIEKKQVHLFDIVLGQNFDDNVVQRLEKMNPEVKDDLTYLYAALYSESDWEEAQQEMKDSMFMNLDQIHFVTLVLKHKGLIQNKTAEGLLELLKDMKGKFDSRMWLNEILDCMEHVFNVGFHDKEILSRKLFKKELPYDGFDVLNKAIEYEVESKQGKWIGEVLELAREFSVLGQDYELGNVVNSYFNIKELSEFIKAAKKIVVFTGAGISTESGIPDFRSSTGVWTYDRSRESLMSLSYFRGYPKKFWPAYKDIFKIKIFGEYKPNFGHQFVADLEKMGKKVVVVTQNVDGLHTEAGSTNVYEVHGTMKKAYCPKCGQEYDFEYIKEHDLPRCNRPKGDSTCNFILKPGIVLFEDAIKFYKESFESIDTADLFLVMGTSLNVGPINQLAIKAKHDPYKDSKIFKAVLINREETTLDYCFDVVINGKIGNTLQKVKELLQ